MKISDKFFHRLNILDLIYMVFSIVFPTSTGGHKLTPRVL